MATTTAPEEEEYEFTDFDAFWSTATHSMIRMVITVSLARVGFVIIWCALYGYTFTFGRIFKYLPRLQIAVDSDQFLTLVELSAWLAICGALVGFIRAERLEHKLTKEWTNIDPDLGEPVADPPGSKGYSPKLRAQAVDAGRRGVRIGTLVGSLAVPMTAWFEIIRERWFNDYVTTWVHYLSIGSAVIPLALLGYLYLRPQETSNVAPSLAEN